MANIDTRDMWHVLTCVDRLWNKGSSLNPELLAQPYVHALMLRIVAEDPELNPSKVSLREGILRCHNEAPCLFHLGTAFHVAGLIADRIRKVTSKYRFMRSNSDRLKQLLKRASPQQQERINAVASKMQVLDDSLETPEKSMMCPRHSAIADLESFLDGNADPVGGGSSVAMVCSHDDAEEPPDEVHDHDGSASGGSSGALVPVTPARKHRVACYDLTHDATVDDEVRELEEFTGGPSTEHVHPPTRRDIAELEGDLLMLDGAAAPPPRSSRALPKATKKRVQAPGDKQKAKPSPVRVNIVPGCVKKCTPLHLVTSRASKRATKAALVAGKDREAAKAEGRKAYAEARETFLANLRHY